MSDEPQKFQEDMSSLVDAINSGDAEFARQQGIALLVRYLELQQQMVELLDSIDSRLLTIETIVDTP